MLKVENISTGYGKKQVLFDVSFEVSQGEIVLLAGSNGSGKSTLLKAIYAIVPQWNNGQIYFEGERITRNPTTALLKKGLFYIPQKNNVFEDLTVKENLEMAGLALDKKILQQRMQNALSVFKILVPHLYRTPMKLSGGERQLLTLAMATLHQPKMILIDEPFTGLSPQSITFVAENLMALNQQGGITLLVAEHRIKEFVRIASKVISLKLGKVFNEALITPDFDIKMLNEIFV
jgi:branched-chain amino acid transport system ATP-binding protein